LKRKAVTVLVLLLFQGLIGRTVLAVEPVQYDFSLSYTFTNNGDESLELTDEDISIPSFLQTEYQDVKIISSSHPLIETELDIDGNKGARFDIPNMLSPGASVNVDATYLIKSSAKTPPVLSLEAAQGFGYIPENLLTEYIGTTETFAVDEEISELALEIMGDEESVLGTVDQLIKWINKNTEYCNFDLPQYPYDTISSGEGDCDDQSILLITMCRSLGIPAFLQVGVVIHSQIESEDTSWEGHLISEQDGVSWHGWTMVYIPPWGWLPVDLTLSSETNTIDRIENAPQYSSNIIVAFNVNNQAYIQDSAETMERIINSDLYVTLKDEAHRSYNGPRWLNYTLIGLGVVMTVAIVMMFRTGRIKTLKTDI
jgi:hypothetical protein